MTSSIILNKHLDPLQSKNKTIEIFYNIYYSIFHMN